MANQIKSIDVFVRVIGPPRMDFAIGKGQSLFPDWMRINLEVRLQLESDDGSTAYGCSGDWPSFGWLDKRPSVDPKQKFRELLELVLAARQAYISNSRFETAFDCWWRTQANFLRTDKARSAVPLCVAFSLALFERAIIDATCRIEGMSFHQCLRRNRLGFQPERIHAELTGFSWVDCFPKTPVDRVHIRHTVGPNDPLTADDVDEQNRLNDGEPFTLEDYIRQNGMSFFKIKICGEPENDLKRLNRIWEVTKGTNPSFTLDGNEAYDDVSRFRSLVEEFSRSNPEMFRRVLFIEQPMNRAMTLDPSSKQAVKEIARLKPLIIDEADGHLHAFLEAVEIGYQGVSHKNCKGLFKSLANYALCQSRNRDGASLFLSAEDLTSMPFVALHQDFAAISAMGLTNAERNGHHFFFGLAHLTDQEKQSVEKFHPTMYSRRGNNLFLNIEDGQVDISSLQTSGLGLAFEPEWNSMTRLEHWLDKFNH